jgi:hypothetical protein
MKLQYELDLDDVVIFNKYHVRHSPTCRRSYYFNLIFGLATAVVIVLLLVRGSGQPVAVTVVLLIPALVFGWLVFLLYWRVSVTRRIRKLLREGGNRGMFGAHTLALLPESLVATGAMDETKLLWDRVERIVEDKAHLYIYVSAISAFIIPKRAFQDKRHMQAFLDEMAKLRAAPQPQGEV